MESLILLESGAEFDYGRAIYVFVICAFLVWLMVFPIGRLFEEYTKERTVRVIWVIAMIAIGSFFFVSMSGVGDVVFGLARDQQQRHPIREPA